MEGADLLQSLVNQAYRDGLLTAPIPVRKDFSIVQYADDTLIMMPACEKELGVLKEILHLYATFTGL